jgi:hypothetical protein
MITQVNADIKEWVKDYKGAKFHALLCDPPYHLLPIVKRFGKPNSAPARNGVYKRTSKGFMGQTWDGGDIAFDVDMWHSLGELLYPGAFMFIYAGTRTYHRVAVAVEDAGFIIHPAIGWITSQGFPKATRIDNQIDRKLGAKREKIGTAKTGVASGTHKHAGNDNKWGYDDDYFETAPSTHLAQTWAGSRYGLMALKPAFEFILCAQRPYDGKAMDNIIENGAGALNIDSARIESRWPSNVVMSHLPECVKIGTKEDSYVINRFTDGAKPFGNGAGHEFESERQTGSVDIYQCVPNCPVYRTNLQASKWTDKDMSQVFYTTPPSEAEDITMYVPKVSPKERHAGLNGKENIHPTLKPIELNRWLSTLLLPPPEYKPRRILVPFAGVLSEAIGAELAGWEEIVAVELTPEYIPIGKARAEYWTKMRVPTRKSDAQLSFAEALKNEENKKQVAGD